MNVSKTGIASASSDRRFWIFNAILSTIAVSFLGWLLLVHQGDGAGADLSFVPVVNASLNAISSVLLLIGFVAIRQKHKALHMKMMVSAFMASVMFLAGYVIYHYAHGDTVYQGVGPIRFVYFTILVSHVLLSIVMLPMILATFYLAWRRRFLVHRHLARWTLPIWMYVSVTGVLIFFMLKAT